MNSVTLFDVYEGNKIPSQGKKSYALSFVMSDKTKTLTDKYVDGVMSKLVTAFKDNLGAELRLLIIFSFYNFNIICIIIDIVKFFIDKIMLSEYAIVFLQKILS